MYLCSLLLQFGIFLLVIDFGISVDNSFVKCRMRVNARCFCTDNLCMCRAPNMYRKHE